MIKVIGLLVFVAVVLAVAPLWLAWHVFVAIRRSNRRAHVVANRTRPPRDWRSYAR